MSSMPRYHRLLDNLVGVSEAITRGALALVRLARM